VETSSPASPQLLWVLPSTGDGEYLGLEQPPLLPDRRLIQNCVRKLEAAGFDGVLITTGHVSNHFGVAAPYLDCLTASGAVAALSQRLKLLVAIRPGLIHPAAAARALASLDLLSDGRVMLNLVSGGGANTMYEPPLGHAEVYARSTEFIRLILELWKGEVAAYDGTFYSARSAVCYPQPLQRPRPLIFVAGSSAEAVSLMDDVGDVAVIPGCPVDRAQDFIARTKGRAVADARPRSFAIHLYVTARASRAEAMQAAERLVSRVDESAFKRARRRLFGLSDDGAATSGKAREIAPGLWDHLRKMSVQPTPMLIGSYNEVSDALRCYFELGFEWFILQSYPMSTEIERIGGELLPRVRTFAAPRAAC
jgi:alkanesulfonate monooxygenase